MELGVGCDCGVFSSAVLGALETGQYGLSGSTLKYRRLCGCEEWAWQIAVVWKAEIKSFTTFHFSILSE